MNSATDSVQKQILDLRQKLAETGFFEKATKSYFTRFMILSILFSILFFYTPQLDFWVSLMAGSLGLALLSLQFGFIAHDAGHGAISPKRWINMLFGHLCFSIINGLGFVYWKGSHTAHHQHCQDEEGDPDMVSEGVISLTESQTRQKKGIVKRLLPFQAYYFWFLAMLYPYKLRYQGFDFLFRNFRKSKSDLMMLVHFAVWLGLPTLFPGVDFVDSLLVYVITSSFMGLLLVGIFSVNHVGMPVIQAGQKPNYIHQQAETSRNISNHPFFDFFFGGLNSQIEHHLFPNAPSMHLRRGRVTVKRFCIENYVNYHEEGYFSAVKSVTRHLARVANLENKDLKNN